MKQYVAARLNCTFAHCTIERGDVVFGNVLVYVLSSLEDQKCTTTALHINNPQHDELTSAAHQNVFGH
jgi:hypothetical protein